MSLAVDWPLRHRLTIEGVWRGVVRQAGELRARIALTQHLVLPRPSQAHLEPGTVIDVEWDAALSDALRQVPLGDSDTLYGMPITLESDGLGRVTVRARGITAAASTLAPPPVAASPPSNRARNWS